MYQFVVGIDVSKATIDASWTESPKPQYLGRYPNTVQGFKQVIGACKKMTKASQEEWLICFENTGTYSKWS